MLKARGKAAATGILVAMLGGVGAAAPACFVSIDEGLLRGDAGGAADATGSADARAGSGDGEAGVATPASVRCGDTAPCEVPVSVCCASSFGDTDYRRGACATREGCKTGDYFACTRPRDCAYAGSAGGRCCVVRLSGGAFTSTTCAASCDGDDGLCDLDEGAGDAGACSAGKSCRASLEFPTLYQCQ